jgi:hypothetical protein
MAATATYILDRDFFKQTTREFGHTAVVQDCSGSVYGVGCTEGSNYDDNIGRDA